LTAADLSPATPISLRLAPPPGFDRYLRPSLAGPLVRYVGEPVAVAALALLGIIARDLPLSPANIARWIREARRGG